MASNNERKRDIENSIVGMPAIKKRVKIISDDVEDTEDMISYRESVSKILSDTASQILKITPDSADRGRVIAALDGLITIKDILSTSMKLSVH